MQYELLLPFEDFTTPASGCEDRLRRDYGSGISAFLDRSVGDAVVSLLYAWLDTYSEAHKATLAAVRCEGSEDGVLVQVETAAYSPEQMEANPVPTSNFQLTGFAAVDP